MRRLLVCLLFAFIALSRPVWAYEAYDVDKLVNAIGLAENSQKYPYGVKSINTHGDKVLARKVCRQSVVNNLRRWKEAGMPCEFVLYMSKRYCPINAPDDPDGLNRNWTKNVLHFYHKEG